MDTYEQARPSSRRSEDSGLALSVLSSRGSSPGASGLDHRMKLDFSSAAGSMTSSTSSLSTAASPASVESPTSENNK